MTIFFIWLAGYIIAYFLGKHCVVSSETHAWTAADRMYMLIISASSVLGILLVGTCFLLEDKIDDTKPVKW